MNDCSLNFSRTYSITNSYLISKVDTYLAGDR
jgi:hypothetical protein